MAVDIHAGAKDEYRIRKTAADAATDDTPIVGTVVGRQCYIRSELADMFDGIHTLEQHRLD